MTLAFPILRKNQPQRCQECVQSLKLDLMNNMVTVITVRNELITCYPSIPIYPLSLLAYIQSSVFRHILKNMWLKNELFRNRTVTEFLKSKLKVQFSDTFLQNVSEIKTFGFRFQTLLWNVWNPNTKFGFQTHSSVWNPNSQKFRLHTRLGFRSSDF